MSFTQEEMKKLNKTMKQNVQASVDYITNYAERYTTRLKEDEEFAKDADTAGLTMLLMHAIIIVESYMELAEKYNKQAASKEVKAEERRILKLLYESGWLKSEEDFYWLEFDAEDRELTQKALSELVRLTAEPEEFEGKQVGYTLVDGYSIDKDSHCTLYVKSSQPERCSMQSFLKYMFEGKKK